MRQRRLGRLHGRLQRARGNAGPAEAQHRVRILSKRLRYGVEALRSVLPARRAQGWYQRARRLQERLGAARDVVQAGAIAAGLAADPDIVAFLRGVAAGQQKSAKG